MHGAPSVSYPVGRSRFAAGLLLLLWLLGMAAVILWSVQVRMPGWQLAASVLLLLAVGLCAAWSWWRAPLGTLSWDGESWNWSAAGQEGTGSLQVGFDLQHWLLLRWADGKASRWLWLERARYLERWEDLRRAVYSRARPQALRQDQPPAAKP
jgi:toxin CptA